MTFQSKYRRRNVKIEDLDPKRQKVVKNYLKYDDLADLAQERLTKARKEMIDTIGVNKIDVDTETVSIIETMRADTKWAEVWKAFDEKFGPLVMASELGEKYTFFRRQSELENKNTPKQQWQVRRTAKKEAV
jgi:hypothetical protein